MHRNRGTAYINTAGQHELDRLPSEYVGTVGQKFFNASEGTSFWRIRTAKLDHEKTIHARNKRQKSELLMDELFLVAQSKSRRVNTMRTERGQGGLHSSGVH